MLQKKYKFSQSSTGLEVIGMPDLSNDDNDNSISIISKWKLSIINQPEIEGGIDHLKSVVKAFYKYSMLILLDQEEKLESNLIDIIPDNDGKHDVLLKSTKKNTKPLKIKLGNAELSDIINCLDQLRNSDNINVNFQDLLPDFKKKKLIKRKNILKRLIPPIIAFLSISVVSFISIYLDEIKEDTNKKISLVINK